MKDLDITEGLAISAWSSLNKAIDSNSAETVYSFISFFRGVIRESLHYNQLLPFAEFISFPSLIYTRIAYRQRENQVYKNLTRRISEQLSLHLKEVIMTIKFQGSTLLTKKEMNRFYYEAFSSFNDFFFQQTKFQDWNLLVSSLKRYSQLTDDLFSGPSRQAIKLINLTSNNLNGLNNDEIAKLESEIEVENRYNEYRRRPLSAIKYWFLLLYGENILGLETLNSLFKALAGNRMYDPNKEIEDVLFFRTGDVRKYMGWEDWDYQERPENEVYSPPMPSNWMTSGFVIDRIRTRNSYFNTSKLDSSLKSGIPFLYDAVKENIDAFRLDFEKWQKVLLVDSLEHFNSAAEKLLSSIALAKRSVVGNKERAIADTPLSENSVEQFKLQMGTAWRAQTRIRRVFNYFGNIQDVTGEQILLKRVGTNTLLEKGKIHFIDGEYHSQIFGLEHFGGTIGKWEDSLFLDVIQRSDPIIIEDKSLLSILEKSIEQLKQKDVIPTAIFLEPEYLYKDEEFLRSDKYNGQYDLLLNPENINSFVLGMFDNIPLFSSNSFQLKDKIIVSNFSEAFLMYHKIDEQWFDGELSVIVNEVTNEIVNEKYAQNPEKWRFTDEGIELSEEDAKVLIKTSVVIDIETIIDFKVQDKSKFVIGLVTEPIAD